MTTMARVWKLLIADKWLGMETSRSTAGNQPQRPGETRQSEQFSVSENRTLKTEHGDALSRTEWHITRKLTGHRTSE